VKKKLYNAWIKALESGKYAQCTGMLRSVKGGYCCLGVLAVVNGASQRTINENSEYGSSCGLSNNQMEDLVYLNDSRKYSFKKIAKWIKKNIQPK
jgi:hypothetical protein